MTPHHVPLPHPSWRNTAWLRRNSWFEAETLAVPRVLVHGLLDDGVTKACALGGDLCEGP